MDIYYTKETLYVNLFEDLNKITLNTLKKRVFRIVEDYEIDNIVLNLNNNSKDNMFLDSFVNEYHSLHKGNLKIN